jgi:ribulose-5-phosphate 4-epimerase/fuculose-1-phosphate aldolase
MSRYNDYRREVLEISRRLSEDGYFGTKSGTAGNVSMLVEGEEVIAVTPTAMRYDLMRAEDICVIDFDLHRIEGSHQPSIESPMHIAAYQVRRDVNAIIHTHQVYASSISILNLPIPPLFDEVTLAIGAVVDVIPYALSGTRELHGAVARKLANRCHCYLIQNHGALCVGEDLEKTFTYVELLEKISVVYSQALATGRPISTLPKPVVEKLIASTIARQDLEIQRKDTLTRRVQARRA